MPIAKNGYETPEHVQISLCGTYHPVVYNTLTGTHVDAAHSHSNGKTTIPWECYNEDSLLLRLTPGDVKTNSPAARTARQYTAEYCLPEPGAYRLSEANVLLLDMAEYALNEEAYRPKEEVLRLDNAVRARLGYPSRQHHVTQPWALGQAETPQDVLKMRFMVHSEIVYDDALLALEVQAGQRVWLNGQPVDLRPVGWFTDKAIQTTRLPPLRPGENILETEVAFGRRTNIEWFYILGDFGVRVSGEHAVITARPQALVYGDSVPQGFAFYGANITYVNAIEADGLHGVELFVPRFNGPLISVAINDEKAGHIAFAPHTLDLGMLPKGRHEIALTLYGNRYNSFGCLHNTNPQATWYGPDCWRTEGNNWAYQYQLRPVGIMQNPVIRLYSNP